nr:hypothetical protein HmN_000107450 [Hymenolepis microstoma]
MLRFAFSAHCVRALSTGAKTTPSSGFTKPTVASKPSVSAKIPTQPQKPHVQVPQPVPAATYSSPYKTSEYYAFSQYSFFDLGAKKQALRNPQPSPHH